MRTGMWGEARARAFGAAAVAAMLVLGGCGGGSDTPALAVAVKVDGVADASNPLTAGESTTISVPSGTTLSFDSEAETRWSPTATDSSYEVNSFSYTAKSMTVSSNGGGTLVVVFTDKADETQKATLTVTVAPKEFERVAIVDGETSDWTYVNVSRADVAVTSEVRTLVALDADTGNYSVAVENLSPTNLLFATTNYDSSDRAVGISFDTAGCTDDAPIVQISYPLHVGKSWSGTSSRMCSGGKAFDQAYVRTVEAFERITVPAGAFNALRIKSVIDMTSAAHISGGAYSYTKVCWWSVDLGRNVKCEFAYDYPEGTPDTFGKSATQTMKSYTK